MRMERRRGVILVLVLVVVSMLTLACLTFADLMLNECSSGRNRQLEAGGLARRLSRRRIGMAVPRSRPHRRNDGGGRPVRQRVRFQGVLIADDDTPEDRGHCSVVAPKIEDRIVLRRDRPGRRIDADQPAHDPQTDQQADGNAKKMLMGLRRHDRRDRRRHPRLDRRGRHAASPTAAESDYYGVAHAALLPRATVRRSRSKNSSWFADVTPQLLFGLDAAHGPRRRVRRLDDNIAGRGQLRRLDGPRLGRLLHGLRTESNLTSPPTARPRSTSTAATCRSCTTT